MAGLLTLVDGLNKNIRGSCMHFKSTVATGNKFINTLVHDLVLRLDHTRKNTLAEWAPSRKNPMNSLCLIKGLKATRLQSQWCLMIRPSNLSTRWPTIICLVMKPVLWAYPPLKNQSLLRRPKRQVAHRALNLKKHVQRPLSRVRKQKRTFS